MSAKHFEIRLCEACGLRYPLADAGTFGQRCPACLGTTRLVLRRDLPPLEQAPAPSSTPRAPCLPALLDNIRSAWNVGAIFRSADGLGVSKLYLCGITPTPENKTVTKTSLGAERNVAWEHAQDGVETARKLKAEGYRLVALEQDERAIPLQAKLVSDLRKAVLIVGNEVTGVDPELLDLCDQIVHIPMRGNKRSLNVEVAFAIAAYTLIHHAGNKKTPLG
ncbi:MAG: RNA methyltransferase [Chloroflexota bacterium]